MYWEGGKLHRFILVWPNFKDKLRSKIIRTVTRTLIGGGGGIFIYSFFNLLASSMFVPINLSMIIVVTYGHEEVIHVQCIE